MNKFNRRNLIIVLIVFILFIISISIAYLLGKKTAASESEDSEMVLNEKFQMPHFRDPNIDKFMKDNMDKDAYENMDEMKKQMHRMMKKHSFFGSDNSDTDQNIAISQRETKDGIDYLITVPSLKDNSITFKIENKIISITAIQKVSKGNFTSETQISRSFTIDNNLDESSAVMNTENSKKKKDEKIIVISLKKIK